MKISSGVILRVGTALRAFAHPTLAEGKGRLFVILQGYFDDSGSHAASPFFVLGGWIAPADAWKTFSTIWDYHLKKEPALEYLRMNEAVTWTGEFKAGWNVPLRNQRLFELAEVIRRSAPLVRVECFLRRSDFENFASKILDMKFYSDPYFMCFYNVVFAVANDPDIGWNKDCDFIFDCHGAMGEHAASWWKQIKETIGEPISSRLGTQPLFRDDKKFQPLQAADMYAWLIRHALSEGGEIADLPRALLPQIENGYGIRLHVSRDELMDLGARLLVAKAQLTGHLPR